MTTLEQRYVAGRDRYLKFQTAKGVTRQAALELWSNLSYEDTESWLEEKSAIVRITGFKMSDAMTAYGREDSVKRQMWNDKRRQQ